MLARQVLAKLAARRHEHAQAETLAGEAVALAETIQHPVAQADARMDLAEVLAMAGQTERAISRPAVATAAGQSGGPVMLLCLSSRQRRSLFE